MSVDISDGREQRSVHLLGTLGGEAGAQKVKWVCDGCGRAACETARDEVFGCVWDFGRVCVQNGGCGAVRAELNTAVEQIQEFGGDVTFPESL